MIGAQVGDVVDEGYCVPAAAAAGIANLVGFDFQTNCLGIGL